MWDRHLVGGTVAELHQREVPLDRRAIWVMGASVPTLVHGSAQQRGVVEEQAAATAGWEVARRRSGGGLVALDPAEVVWVDVVVPAGDPLWSDDVGRAFEWLGDAWVRALSAIGVAARAHRAPAVAATAGRVVCFAGVGPGEVLVGDAKLVGLSQRRTRAGARFQCLVHRRWQPQRWWDLVEADLTPPERSELDPRRDAVIGLADLGEAIDVPDLVVAALVTELLALG